MSACRRHYPGRSDGTVSLVHSHRLRPSPNRRRAGPCIVLFEACSAFTHVTACMLTESPTRPSTPKASAASLPPPLLRLLPGGANQFPGGFNSRCGPPPFTAHPVTRLYRRGVTLSSIGNEWLLLEYQRRSAYSLPFEVDCHLDPISDFDERNATVHPVVLAVEGHRPFNLA